MQLWANANKAFDDLLNTKVSIDAQRQRAVWQLGVVLHQNESPAATSIKEAKAICSQVTLDAQTTCSQLILKAKTDCLAVVKKNQEAIWSKKLKLPVPKPSAMSKPRGSLRLHYSKRNMATS